MTRLPLSLCPSRVFVPAALALACGLGLAPRPAPADVQATFYAAPGGTGRDCVLTAPCSLEGARDRVREVSAGMTGDVLVYLRGGTYELAAPFELTEGPGGHDSGTNGYFVVYQAYPGEKPVLSGGRRISGWVLADPVRDIYRAAVSADLETRQIFVNGVRATRARGPLDPQGWTKTATGYTAPDTSMAGWGNPGDIEIVSRVLWKSFRCGVASITETHVTMDQPCWSNAHLHAVVPIGLPSWVENAYELLDAPGEWYLDRSADFLYYKPRPNEVMATAEVVAPVLETLVRGSGAPGAPLHHVRLQGITFSHTTWLRPNTPEGYPDLQAGWAYVGTGGAVDRAASAVLLTAVRDVHLERNRFLHLGGIGLEISGSSQDSTVAGNVFSDISSSGILLGTIYDRAQTDSSLQHRNLRLRNNDVARVAVEYEGSVGVFGGILHGAQFVHNEVRNLPYTGIALGWGWDDTSPTYAGANTLTHNHVHDHMQLLVDGGGIYTLNQQPGSSCSYNFIDNGVRMMGGLYHDNGTQGYSSAYNVVTGAPFWLNIQQTHQTRDNAVMFNCSDTVAAYHGLPGHNTVAANYTDPPAWPGFCQTTIANAGIEAAYQDIRLPEVGVSDASVAESAGQAVFTVALADEPVVTARVAYATANCTAAAGSDYAAVSGTLTFSPGGPLTQTVSVPVADDGLPEGGEMFFLSLTSPTGAVLGQASAKGRIVDDDGLPRLVPRADFNGDNSSDLVVQDQTTGDLAAWFLDGVFRTGGAAFTPARPAASNWRLAASHDFNGDGSADLLFRNDVSGRLSFWLMSGTTRTTGVLVDGEADLAWDVAASADFNGDAKPDLIWRRTDGALKVWYLDGTAHAGTAAIVPPAPADPGWQLAAVGDLSGDAKPDLLWRHQSSGALVVWVMDGVTRTSGAYLDPASLPDMAWQVVALWDVDADGKGDIVWRHGVSRRMVVWLMDGTTRRCGMYLSPSAPEDAAWRAVGPR